MTALLDLRNNRNAQTGQKVLIDYTSGGVGIFAVQAGAYSLENGHTNFIKFGSQTFTNQDFAKDILCKSTKVSSKICIT